MKKQIQEKPSNQSIQSMAISCLNFMALGLFVSLITGLIMKEIGGLLLHSPQAFAIGNFFYDTGVLAMSLTGAAIGASIAYGLKAPELVLFSGVITGMAGYAYGGPVGALIAATVSVEIGRRVSKKTKVDILITPMVTIITGVAIAKIVGAPVDYFMQSIGEMIMWATNLQPFFMGIIIAVVVGMILTTPLSSAALCIMLNLSGLAAGAAAAGCSAQMIGFAVASYRENKVEGLLSQGLGTSMLQVPNIVKNPKIWIPAIVASAVVGPISTVVFQMENTAVGAGMGTSGLVGQIAAFSEMGYTLNSIVAVVLTHFIIPALVVIVMTRWLRRMQWIYDGDMKLIK